MESWFAANTGPAVPITSTFEGTYTVSNQTEADALSGVRVIGKVEITAGSVTLEDFEVVMPEAENPTSARNLIEVMSSLDNITIRRARLDGLDKMWARGVFGSTGRGSELIEYCDFTGLGVDGIFAGKNSTYQYNYMHDFRAWNEATDGVYNTDTDPHSDGIQALRSGNTIVRNWITMTNAENGTSALMINSDTTETLVGCVSEENYLDGGGYTAHVHPGNNDIDNPGPYGYPRGIEFTDNLFGRTARESATPFSTDGVPNENGDLITWSGNVYDDDREAVPLPTVVPRPAELVYDGTFDDPVESALNWISLPLSGGTGTVDVTGGDLEISRGGGQAGRGFYMINCVVGESYDLTYDFTKTLINMVVNVGISRTGTGSSVSSATRTATGSYTQTFTATQPDHYVYYTTGTGSDGNVINIDNISVELTP